MSTPLEHYAAVAKKADEIETELKRIGGWSEVRPPASAFQDMGAFGQKTLSLEAWIQFVLLPNVREAIATKGEFPDESMVGTYAIREWDGSDEHDPLITLLCEFDEMFG